MAVQAKPGTRIFSAVCDAELIIVKSPGGELDITIGGATPVLSAAERNGDTTIQDGHDGGAIVGKRYVDDAGTVELLCTKPGAGAPALAGEILEFKEAKSLPSSD